MEDILKTISLLSSLLLFTSLLSFSAQAKSFKIDGHSIDIPVERDSTGDFFVDGKAFKHSGKIRLKSSEFYQDLGLRQTPQDQSLFVMQFESQVFSGYHEWLKSEGVEIVKFVPDHALLVQTTGEKMAELMKAPQVKQVVRYGGSYKVAGIARTDWFAPREFSTTYYDLLTVNEASRQALLAELQTMGVSVRHNGNESFAVTVLANIEDVEAIAALPHVIWIEKAPDRMEFDMDNVLITGGAASLIQSSGGGYQGEGIRGHVLEGIYPEHQDFVADQYRDVPIAIGDDGKNSHGQATFGIIYGAGHGDPSARGLMPRAQGFYTNNNFVYNKDNRFALTEELINDHQIMLQTASWGYPTTTQYTARSLEMDEIIFKLDFLVTQSQSNRKSKNSRPQAWAKNIVSVGGVAHRNNTDFSDDSWGAGGASIGPASDGRIKPDIVSYYDGIHTTGSTKYTTFGGTSGATPIINGHLGLIIEMFTDGIFGNELAHPVEERFLNRPHAATAKALLINSARQYEFQGLNHDMARVHQGWGHPSLDNLYANRDKMMIVDESEILETLQSKEYEVEVVAGTPQLAVTMIYNDPPGVVGAEFHRVNDLDVTVVDPNGVTYHGNNGLTDQNMSIPGGSPDVLNTVENVFVAEPVEGTWKVIVNASEINQDGHLETPEVDADYALVISGIQTTR